MEEKRALRNALKAQYAQRAGMDFSSRVMELNAYKNAGTVAVYYGVGEEAGTAALRSAPGKRLVLPRCEGDVLVFYEYTAQTPMEKGAFGIPEPCVGTGVPLREIDLLVVPAMAYDRAGYRRGRGKGYYDRALARFDGVSVGLIHSRFLLDRLPHEAHDRRFDYIITE